MIQGALISAPVVSRHGIFFWLLRTIVKVRYTFFLTSVLLGMKVGSLSALLVWIVVRWIPWSRKWFVLTDRRVIASWGVLNRNQAALLLDRIQDASLTRPFPLRMIRGYGVLHLESAGEHAEERISGGLRELAMTNATAFYRALTDAQTPG